MLFEQRPVQPGSDSDQLVRKIIAVVVQLGLFLALPVKTKMKPTDPCANNPRRTSTCLAILHGHWQKRIKFNKMDDCRI